MGGSSDYFRFDPKSTTGPGYTTGTAESLTVSGGCTLGSAVPTKMTITPTPSGGSAQGKVGLVGHSLGVQVKGEGNGTPCGQVNGTSQALTLSLGGTLASDEMDYAELDVEGKYGVTVNAELYNDGTLVRTELLPTGGPDSGPDSSDGDNFRWRLPASDAGVIFFDQIRLSVNSTTPTGAFSLEGGSDGTAPQNPGLGSTLNTTDSLFHITNIDGVLGCGADPVTGGGTGTPTITVTLVGGDGCQSVPYAITGLNSSAIAFQKLGGTSNTYNATIVFPVEQSEYPVGPTQIDYGDTRGLHDLVWCNGTYLAPVAPSGEAWCLRKHDAKLNATGLMQVTEELFGRGDPTWGRS
jgi:hypothetical protein